MTTRQQKRIIWNRLITELELLETQHFEIDGQLSCGKCEICKQILIIGKQLSSPEDEAIGRKHIANTLNEKLTIAEYWAFKDERITDEAICKIKKVSSRTLCEWKLENNIVYRMSVKGISKRSYADRTKKTKGDVI